jgi:hypothetical protein
VAAWSEGKWLRLSMILRRLHDASLHRRCRKDRVHRLGEALEAIDHGNQDVLDAAGLQIVDHLHPELRPFGLLDPQPDHVARAIGQHARGRGKMALSLTTPSSRIARCHGFLSERSLCDRAGSQSSYPQSWYLLADNGAYRLNMTGHVVTMNSVTSLTLGHGLSHTIRLGSNLILVGAEIEARPPD